MAHLPCLTLLMHRSPCIRRTSPGSICLQAQPRWLTALWLTALWLTTIIMRYHAMHRTQVYMVMLTIFCTNSINILAGVNGLEAGQV